MIHAQNINVLYVNRFNESSQQCNNNNNNNNNNNDNNNVSSFEYLNRLPSILLIKYNSQHSTFIYYY